MVIERFLKRIAGALDRQRLPYMIIGGQAVLIHGRPRLTQDVDVTLGVDTDSLDAVLTGCRRLQLTLRPENPRQFAEERKVLPAHDARSGLRVDFIFSNTPYERQAIRHATIMRMAGYPVRFSSAEDLVIHKVFAGRAIDLEDVRAVVLKQGDRLDTAYIKKWLRAFGDAVEDGRNLVAIWDRLAKGLKG